MNMTTPTGVGYVIDMSNPETILTFVVCLICIMAGVGIGLFTTKRDRVEEEEPKDDTAARQGEDKPSPQKKVRILYSYEVVVFTP